MARPFGAKSLGGPTKELSLSLTKATYDAVSALAEPNDQTVATWIRRAVQQRLERELSEL